MAAERATIPYLETLRPVDINNTAVKIYQIDKKNKHNEVLCGLTRDIGSVLTILPLYTMKLYFHISNSDLQPAVGGCCMTAASLPLQSTRCSFIHF